MVGFCCLIFIQTYNPKQIIMAKKIAFGWYGGKYSHLAWLLPMLPPTTHYCEPFGGSAAVLLNRLPSPVETYNDIYGEVVNFFEVLRSNKSQLVQAISLTPFSRKEFNKAISLNGNRVAKLERARLFYVKARQVRNGLAQSASNGRWAHCKLTSRAEMAGAVSRWLGSVEDLPEIAQRLLRVQIENDDALKIINRYDSKETLFYCDPPYPHTSRKEKSAYKYEMSEKDHIELSKVLKKVKGKVALSGYRCDLLDDLYDDWELSEGPRKKSHSGKSHRREALWTNYSPPKTSTMK